MKTTFTTHNDGDIDVIGTSRYGTAQTTYARLVEVFGEPLHNEGGFKVDWEWNIEFMDDGHPVVATIYNWKNGPNYCGPEGLHHSDIKEWNIGGACPMSVFLILEALKGGKK